MCKENIIKIEYPSCEIVRVFPKNELMPIKDIILGITNPNPNYIINRKGNNKNFLFECILEGKGLAKFENKWHIIESGDLLFYKHEDIQQYKSDRNNPFKKIFISFSCDYIDNMINAYSIKSGIYNLNLTSEYNSLLNFFLKDSNYESFYFYLANFLNKIIITIASQTYSKESYLISQIKNELGLSAYQKTTLSEIAKKFNLSKSAFIRYFKKETNETPYQYLLSEKIRVSKILLKTTDKSIKEISYLLSFTDEHYFSYYFKKNEGKTPTQYKNTEQPKSGK